jgi:type VI secretion system secreted protein VgrG
VSYSQEGRPIRIKTSLGDTELMLEGFSGQEAISQPFSFVVSMISENASIDATGLLRKPATIYLRLADGSDRCINGIFSSVRQKEMTKDGLVSYEGVLVPSLWLLTLTSDCYIYQSETVPDIVANVLKTHGVTEFSFATTGTYTAREYCVQYRETAFNFVSRLLEEEGIFYYFEHTDGNHKIIFSDASESLPACPRVSTFSYSLMADQNVADDIVTQIEPEQQLYTGKVTLTEYNFETPNNSLLVTLAGTAPDEAFDYPGEYSTRDDGDRYASVRLEELEARQSVARGSGNCRPFCSGYKFTLEDHYRSDVNQSWLLISITHQATDTTYRAGRSGAFSYTNTFEAIPQTIPFRPPRRTRRPIVTGPQTAVVVGKSGEEIWVDNYGRVKVQFFWDRVGTSDENSSCWIRVSQSWAGKNWGWVTIPRIGQEVVVDFLEGNPDTPLITGRVYNADQMPPYTVPDNQTQSGIKTRSSKGGGTSNFNELTFEDKMGSELITVHAEKDMDTTIENNDTQTVQKDRTITVQGKHTETITGNTTITVDQGNHSETLNQGNRALELKMGNESIKIDLGKSEKEAMQSITLKVGQNSIKIDQTGITISGLMIKLQAQVQLQGSAPMTSVSGDGMLTLKGGITMIN